MQTNEKHYFIRPEPLDVGRVRRLIEPGVQLELSEESRALLHANRSYLEDQLRHDDQLLYGINTGFGSLYNIRISKEEIVKLQHNLVQSHACGMGDEAPPELVRIMLLLKIKSLAYGYSGVRLELVERLIEFFNRGITPVIYELGSLGASGDLAPLAHLSLPLIGEGEVDYQGQRYPSGALMQRLNLKPLELQAKEGLALLNGTQFSGAYGVWCTLKAERFWMIANVCGALSVDAFNCNLEPFDPRLQEVRGHEGQIRAARHTLEVLRGSEIARQAKNHLQDPYAFRCIPQVHGASWNAIDHVWQVVLTEINSVTDNPIIFHDSDAILSGGNFHAQPLALPLDYLAIALSELGNISERRTYQLISGKRGLPDFLTPHPGLNSGLMIPQYTAASIVSQNKQLCTPASVDSIVSSNLQEDHVSMAANAATKAYRVVRNLERILAIEFLTAAQALEFRRPLQTSPYLESLLRQYRQLVPKLESDRILSHDMVVTIRFLRTLDLILE